MLIALSGRSGVGKSTIARALARETGGVWLRIDSIEQAIRASGTLRETVDDAGYLAAHAVAEDNLRLGRTVISDSVNDWMSVRDAWRDVGQRVRVSVLEVEVMCSEADEHRHRIETRICEVPGLKLPDWDATMRREYHAWNRDHLVVDTAGRSVSECVADICSAM